jgi:uncharacterized membrane protein
MFEFFETHTGRAAFAVLLFAVMLLLIAAGALIVARFRDTKEDDTLKASKLLTKFGEMHSQGELTDQEYRTIKAKLGLQLQRELRDSEEPG